MKSNVNNAAGFNVIQIGFQDNSLFELGNDGAGNLTYIQNSMLSEQLNPNVQYQVDRIRIILTRFDNPDVLTEWAYARWEQYDASFYLDLYQTDVNGNIIVTLFQNMIVRITDGITENIIFKEPFVFETDVSNINYLKAVVTPSLSFFGPALGNLTLPPLVGTNIRAIGGILLEGFTRSPGAVDTQKQINQESSSVDISLPQGVI